GSVRPPMGAGSGSELWTPVVIAGVARASGRAGVTAADVSGVSAGTNQATLVGRLSVPQSWTAAAQVANPAGATFPGGGWTSAVGPAAGVGDVVPAGGPGMPGMPPATAGDGVGHGPRSGFRPTALPRPPAAGWPCRDVTWCKRVAVGLTTLLAECHYGRCMHLAR